MAPNYSSLHQQLIQKIIAAAGKKLSAAERAFITEFYVLAPLNDLTELDPVRGAALALATRAVFVTRKGHGPVIQLTQTKLPVQEREVTRTQLITINDDMPFLVDSLSALFTSLGLTIHRIQHPILATKRNAKGALTELVRSDAATVAHRKESLIYMELSALPAQLSAAELEHKIRETLVHVAQSVADWKAMSSRIEALATEYAAYPKETDRDEAQEVRDLLYWLAENHFVFLGYAEYMRKESKTHDKLMLKPNTALGVYALPAAPGAVERSPLPTGRGVLSVLKASEVSQVHRRSHMDYIVLRRVDAKENFIGEVRLLGLFTSTVYYRETGRIPFLRRKTAKVMARAGFTKASHAAKTLKATLEFMPRDELFQMDDEQLFQMAMGIVSLEARPQVRMFLRQDEFERFIAVMVYVPRERMSTELRTEIIRVLERAYSGHATSFSVQMADSPLARITVHIGTTPGQLPQVDTAALEATISALANVWTEALREALISFNGETEGETLAATFSNAFPVAYVNAHSAAGAAYDVRRVMECLQGDGLALELYRRAGDPSDQLHLKCYTRDLNSELSAIIPLLENMGCTVVDATPYTITPLPPLVPVLLRNFTLRSTAHAALALEEAKARIEDAIGAIWRGKSDNDTLNALVLSAGLSVRDVSILRAYSRYLQQLDFPYSQSFIAAALGAHATMARELVALFHARFAPKQTGREKAMDAHGQSITAALEQVTNLAEDRIIRRILAVIQATLRTNFYQTSAGAPKPYLSLKIRSNLVPGMPLPVPYAEIFVTSLRMEGIHLRGGSVARGGLRWSDRPEDFRSEVLGLVKAQMVKNAVIVPQGAKGGFILRKAPTNRDALMEEGIACYRMFLSGLLDITDNLAGTTVVPPKDVVRHDGDDPYLVVAADKGTATFSDIANAVAADYDFWLGDAFASGGSAGYDHKHMAITARGGWVAVERHFREMGVDIAQDDFTAIGVGDMSGDVFGNGMLLSHRLKLVAAFNHRHIFIDPTPNPATSYAERQRLYNLARSGWNDYNPTLISKGGGVFDRSAKSITLNADIRKALDTEVTSATPDELIRLILKAPVDLLWNGGIGTYVKASSESQEQVGDRANAALRVNGRELRCKIVGEGGNLGLTQRGRIEYARLGGRINTDAIDNSGGVDCSDHEVNIKIALGKALQAGRTTIPKRNTLLKKMTDNVAELVLLDNRLQTQAITIAEAQGAELLDPAEQLMRQLEGEKFLNREVEFLPDVKQLAELRAARQGLSRPEIAVLLAYAKMALYRDLKESPLLDAPYFEDDLRRYFPIDMQKQFAGEIASHRLRRDIVATRITNSIVNRAGFSFAHGLMRATGLDAADIAQAYIATRDAFNLRALWAEIESLDGKIAATLQAQLFASVNLFIEHSCRWFLTHLPQPMQLDAVMARYAQGIATLSDDAEALMTETLRKAYRLSIEQLSAQAIPPKIAEHLAKLEILASACDIIDIATATKQPLKAVGATYFELGAQLKLGWLRRSARTITAENDWQRLAVKSLQIELYQAQRRLTQDVLTRYAKKKSDPAQLWAKDNADGFARYLTFIEELRMQPALDYAMLIVALRQVQSIISQ